MCEEARDRRNKSIALLDRYGVKHIDFLPLIETVAKVEIKDEKTIIERFIATMCSIQVACSLRDNQEVEGTKKFFEQMLTEYGLSLDDVTNKEKTVWDGTNSEQDILDVGWRYEAIYLLFWALGFVDELEFPSDICDVTLMFQLMKDNPNFAQLAEKARLRSTMELLDMADYIYCLRWASVDAYVNKQPQPANMSFSVLIERHRAINWLTLKDEADFDTVALDT
jgi:hypothetical protein